MASYPRSSASYAFDLSRDQIARALYALQFSNDDLGRLLAEGKEEYVSPAFRIDLETDLSRED